MEVTQEFAIELCKKIEDYAPLFGCHVALTGGCLYNDGPRKDIDILFYRIRQVDKIDVSGLLISLRNNLGFIFDEYKGGWLVKGKCGAVNVDVFFPENQGDEQYTKEELEAKKDKWDNAPYPYNDKPTFN